MAQQIKKVLVVNIFGIGDVLFTTPLLRNIKNTYPGCSVIYVANRRAAEALERNPCVDRVIIYERSDFVAALKKSRRRYWLKIVSFVRSIRNEQCDIAFDLSLNSGINFLLWCCGIKNIVGYKYRNRSFFLNQAIPLSGYEDRHVVEYYLALGEAAGLKGASRHMELPFAFEDRAWVEACFKKEGVRGDGPVIAFFPGGGASWGKDARFKQWPVASYAGLINKVIEKFSAKVILLGDQKDRSLSQGLARSVAGPVINLCGDTTLLQIAALLTRCDVAVMNDGGPLHVAVASGVRTVSIFGPVNEIVYGPYPREGHEVVTSAMMCRPCYRYFRRAECAHVSCLNRVTPEDVFEKIEVILSTQGKIKAGDKNRGQA
ncbi:MAG TPA: glycosyltransferase family 9 protein [Candidatus Omnitrophota bacterium]|nr:glycosyltransferase family 9 protein [Candidatus Omnitrophota bacterium]